MMIERRGFLAGCLAVLAVPWTLLRKEECPADLPDGDGGIEYAYSLPLLITAHDPKEQKYADCLGVYCNHSGHLRELLNEIEQGEKELIKLVEKACTGWNWQVWDEIEQCEKKLGKLMEKGYRELTRQQISAHMLALSLK